MVAGVTNDVQAHNYEISSSTEKTVTLSQCPWHRRTVSQNCDLIYEISHVLRNVCIHATDNVL